LILAVLVARRRRMREMRLEMARRRMREEEEEEEEREREIARRECTRGGESCEGGRSCPEKERVGRSHLSAQEATGGFPVSTRLCLSCGWGSGE
jgi:hypothetical protein